FGPGVVVYAGLAAAGAAALSSASVVAAAVARWGVTEPGYGRPAESARASGRGHRFRALRLIVARCEVRYSGRLTAVLPEALRLLMIKSDGSVMVHSDAGGYKPENWMTPPTLIEESPDGIVVRKVREEDRLDIRIA